MNILLIEDDAGLVELIRSMLEELGFSVMSATTGNEALAHLKKQTPDLMLLDYSLPDINGKELIETLIKQQLSLPPFILTTGQGDERIAVDIMKLGAMDYLVKDILFLEKLPDVVQRVVKEIEITGKLKRVEETLKKQNQEYEVLNKELTEANRSLSTAKNKAEENQKLYEDLVQSSHNLIWKCDLEGKFTFLNSAWENTHGYKVEEMLGKPFSDFQRAEVFERDVIEFTKHLAGGFVKDYETTHIIKDGTEIPLIFNALPLFNSVGEIVGTQGTAFDISKLKQTELELIEAKEKAEESEERFELAMAASKDGLYDWNLETNEIYYSPGWKKMLGYEDDELPNDFSSWEKLTDPKDVDRTWKMHLELIHKQRDHVEIEFKMKHKDGHWVDILSRSNAVFDENGKAIRKIGTHVDITERKREEKVLEVELKLFEYAINHSEEELLQKFLDEAEKLTESTIGFYHYIEDDQESISLQTWSSNTLNDMCKGAREATLHYPISKAGVWVDCIKERKAVIHNDYSSLAHKKGLPEGHAPIIRELVVPVIRGNQIKAVLGVGNKKSDYKESDVKSIQRLADVAWETVLRKQAEEKIHAAEKNLQNTFDLSPSIIAKANMNEGRFTQANKAVTKILGYTVDEFTSKPYMEFVHPDDWQSTIDIATEQLKGNDVTFFENRYLCKDGSYKWMAWHGTKPDKNGIVTTIGSDINERKIIEQQIIETKQFYEDIIEGVQDGIWVTDKNDVIFYANKAVEKISGMPREQIQGNNILKDFPEEITGELVKFYQQAKKEKKPIWYDIKVTTLAKIDTWQNGWLIPQYENEKFTGIICTIRDVSERKKAESSVRRLSTAVKQSPSMVVITDTEGNVEYVNPKFTELTGYSSTEAIGQKSNILKSGKQDTAFYKEMWQTVDSGKVWRGQFHNKKKNGELFWEAASISAILNESGDVINFIKIGEDITQQKNTEMDLKAALEKARESDRLKSAFLANMSHEIRTPMNGILGFAGLLKEPGLIGEKQQDYIGVIEKSGARMLNIINDIVSISKIESGQVDIYISNLNINEQLEYMYAFFNLEAESKGLKLSFNNSLPNNEASIKSDREKLLAVLTNLVKNAIKYSDKGSIEIGYVKKNNFIEFYVKDTGIGVEQDRQEAIFERFIQADIEDKNAYQGAGLGLAISKAYVEMLYGKIWIESKKGIGSTFYFTVPCNYEIQETITITENIIKSDSGIQLKNLKILIVEDDETSNMLLDTILEKIAKQILHAANGVDAIELFDNNSDIDLILMDMKMPVMDGYEATRRIRAKNKEVVIIAQTAYGLLGDKELAIEAGCNAYIKKPIVKSELFALIEQNT